jgi:myosin heavy subunit
VEGCKPLVAGILHLGNVTFTSDDDDGCMLAGDAAAAALADAAAVMMIDGRSLHSSTFWFNLSGFNGTGVAFKGCVGGV